MALTITGLQSNYYLANNPIYITVRETLSWDYATIKLGSLPVAIVTPIEDAVRVDIAPFIKSLMPNVSFNVSDNIMTTEIRVTTFKRILDLYLMRSQATLTKTFIRGGNSRNLPNYNLTANQLLKVTDKIPYWSGYDARYSRMIQAGSLNTISEYPVDHPQNRPNQKERLSVKGCNPKFVKFLNRLGGYSYWLFEVSETTLTNNDLGTINNSYIADLGYSYNEEIELYSKVPERYMALMEDLIFSPSTWLFEKEANQWHRVKLSNNNVKTNRANKAQEFRIKIKPFTNYNPSLIW